ncbi:SEC-C metal-binding domain-containing protein [Aquibacillus rhizosphaerae]|uniref:SEC-C metal-binding domain-containing protein n=1 Tax=Aquibacillus rhizosphaerae TaxID=3051431 RepID=A0ABT7LCW1_9BACI|nr:SEC-C metal-binding domain-containing protein [Aquibacillus sp. LR5S19]MDL4843097.1 SEC-C metal-binding domain-containing protein [Aquibacillus sp. LR5S19]
MSIGRNDPCPCGSGKKHKKCCMNNIVSLDSVITSELDQLQQELFFYAEHNYEVELSEIISDLLGETDIRDKDGEEELTFVLFLMWVIFQVEIDDSTIVNDFIKEKENKKSVRPSVFKHLEHWKGTPPTFSVIRDVLSKSSIEVEDLFTKEVKKVHHFGEHLELEKNGLLLGFMVPYGEFHTYLPLFLDFSAEQAEDIIEMVEDSFQESEFIDPNEYMVHTFPDYVKLFITGEDNIGFTQLEWSNPFHKMVADIFEKRVNEENNYPNEYTETGIMLWYLYCQKEDPVFRKPAVYAAALHYFADTNFPLLEMYTQKELAESYQVAVTSLSKAYRKLEDGLTEEMDQLDVYLNQMEEEEEPFERMSIEKTMRQATEAIQDKEFDSIEELDKYVKEVINQPELKNNVQRSKREQAQDLIYQAYETTNKENRIRLAKQALNQYPNTPDAYNILGDIESNPIKALQKYKTGMEVGEQDLGKKFFERNEGMFWGLVETRPYMRAKYNYAVTLMEISDFEKAIKQMEELIELNENDNQGIRDILFLAYVGTKKFQLAKNLLDKFSEDFMASGAYNNVLIEYLLNGITSKLNKLLKQAKNVNPHVIKYLIGSTKVPNKVPEYYKPGDKNEAAMYVLESHFLWKQEKELMEWLKK